ncbi:MAG: hypothetical protein HC896_07965, partial [Bacteroidales bacterium]|nr:hypothetical protein [Bacteroidales bacterium]
MSRLIKVILLTTVYAINSPILSSQTGPGGVGNTDGSNGQPENILWLDASNGVAYDGSNNVTLWNDISGNSNAAVPPVATNQPLYVANGGAIFNSQPVIRFANGNNDYFRIEDNDRLDNTDELTVVTVFMANNFNGNQGLVSKRTDVNQDQAYVFFTDN